MQTFKQWLNEAVKFDYLYHGTSSEHLPSIEKHGLKPQTGKLQYGKKGVPRVYATPDISMAHTEAENTIKGENDFKGVGGHPVVLAIDRKATKGWKNDPEYGKRASFHMNNPIDPNHIKILKPGEESFNDHIHHSTGKLFQRFKQRGLASQHKALTDHGWRMKPYSNPTSSRGSIFHYTHKEKPGTIQIQNYGEFNHFHKDDKKTTPINSGPGPRIRKYLETL